MTSSKESISFYSGGLLIKGDLYIPNSKTPSAEAKFPAVVLAHGFAGVKELLIPAFAQRMSEAGYISLCFDYRGFGESEGNRGRLVPALQIEDIRNAITYMQSRNDVEENKIALWGTSFGGANAIYTAAVDKRVKCLLIQLTFANGERVITGEMNEDEKLKLTSTIDKVWKRNVSSNKDLQLGLKQLLSDEQSKAFYDKYVIDFPQLDIKLSFLTLKETMEHKAENVVENITVPIHITAAENDSVNPVEESKILFNKAQEPKEINIIEGATHYDVYEGDNFNNTVSQQIAWLNKYLN